MSYVFRKVFAPLLSRLCHLDRHYGLGILIADCIGTRVRMGFLYRRAIVDVAGDCQPRIRVTPVAPSPTLIITPDEGLKVRRLPRAPHFARDAPPRVHWLPPPTQPIHRQSPLREDLRITSHGWPLVDPGHGVVSSSSFEDNLQKGPQRDFDLDMDLLQFSEVATDPPCSFTSPHSPSCVTGRVLIGEPLYSSPEPLSSPLQLPSSPPSHPPGLSVFRSLEESTSPSLPLQLPRKGAGATRGWNSSKASPYTPDSDKYADEVTSPFENTYIISGMVGRGGWGRVMAAIRPERAEVVAIKVVHKRMAYRQAGHQLDSWVMEKRCMQLGRQHDVREWVYMHECWHDKRNVYFVMEMGYGTLRDQIAGNYDHVEAKLWCREMLLAVKALKEHHIIHSDIKPENFLVVRGGSVVLSDFGLAQTPDPPTPTIRDFLEWRATPGGTTGYLAPEALSTQGGYVTHDSDIFSLGVVFAELLGRVRSRLWNVAKMPRGYPCGSVAWFDMREEQRQEWLMRNIRLEAVDLPKESPQRDLCEKMLYSRLPVEELLSHVYLDELFDGEGTLRYYHNTTPRMRSLRIDRKNRDLTFEAWYRPGDSGPYGPQSPSFSPIMNGSKVVESQWLKDTANTEQQLSEPFPRDFNWLYQEPGLEQST